MATPDKQRKQAPATLALMAAALPSLINPARPKPLAVGIVDQLPEVCHLAGLTLSKTKIRRAIGLYCSRLAYQKALAEPGSVRINANLTEAGEVTEEQREHARAEIIRILPLVQEKRKKARQKAKEAAEKAKEAAEKDRGITVTAEGAAPVGLFDPVV